jgi:hypothetical protein
MVGSYAGSDVLRSLSRAASTARRAADDAEAAAARARDHVDALSRERMQTLRELAKTQLPELNAITAGAAMPEIAAEMQQIEQQREARASQLADALAKHEGAMSEAKDRASARTADLDRVVARRDELLQQAADRLAKDPKYPALEAEATTAEVCLQRDIARRDELLAEAKAKLPPYEKSRLFQYLWRSKFGTPEYAARGFVARWDRRLASYIRYQEFVGSYKFLRATPELVRLEVERRSVEVKQLKELVEGMERAAQADVGVPAVQAEVERLLAERDAEVQRIEQIRQQISQVHAAVRDEVGSRGVFHGRALERLTAFLSEAEQALLVRRARETPDPKDDQLVAALRACTDELARVGRDSPQLQQAAAQRDSIADGLESVLVRFRQADFDGGRSEFHGLQLEDMVSAASTGGLRVEELWSLLQSRQRFRPPPPVYHQRRSHDVLNGVGLAVQIGGAVVDAMMRSGGSIRIGHGGGSRGSDVFSRGGGFGRSGGGGGGGFTTTDRF